jgi:hypothetical protein
VRRRGRERRARAGADGEVLPRVGGPAGVAQQGERLLAAAGVDHVEALDHPRGVPDGGELRGVHVVDDREAGRGGGHLVLEEDALVGGVDRHLDRAADAGAQPGAEELRGVGGHDQHPVAGAGAGLGQAVGHRLGLLERLRVGEGQALLGQVEEHRVGTAGGVVAQHRRERPVTLVREDRHEVRVVAHLSPTDAGPASARERTQLIMCMVV